MEIIMKHLVLSFAGKFRENEVWVTRYRQNSVRVVKGESFQNIPLHITNSVQYESFENCIYSKVAVVES